MPPLRSRRSRRSRFTLSFDGQRRPASPLLPADRWLALFNVYAVLAWLPLLHAPLGRALALTHLVALSLPLLLRAAPPVLSPPVRLLREIYPVLWICAFWSELGLRHLLVPTSRNDAAIIALDQLLFGGHPNLTWIPAMPQAWLSESFHAFYFAYYPLLILVPLGLMLIGNVDDRREIVLRLAVTYLACFAIYLVFPVIGPLELYPRAAETYSAGIFYQLNLGIRGVGDSLGTAFPSSHTAGSITVAWIAWRCGPKWLAWATTIVAVGVAFATVYTQNHFAADPLAATLLTPMLQGALVPWLLGRALTQRVRLAQPERTPDQAEPLAA